VDKVPKLPDEHLEKAKEIVLGHRNRKSCKSCYDRGYQGINEVNMLVTCPKCVDGEALMVEWRVYVKQTPALAEMYGDYFEEDEDAEKAEEPAGARRDSGSHRPNHGAGTGSGPQPPRAGSRLRRQAER